MATKAVTIKKDLNLQQMVDVETENRKILTQFITSHMQSGTDFGSIQIGGKLSKPSLFKAGAEKFASLMKLRADTERDNDTWEMAGSKPGLFCYKCRLYDSNGIEVGMGLGACSVEEKKSYNNAIKIAKKRAFVDAILTTGALSDFFTQDLEDQIDNPTKRPYEESHTVGLATEGQIKYIKDLLLQKHFTETSLFNKFNITDYSQLTFDQASDCISNLKNSPPAQKKIVAKAEPEVSEEDYSDFERSIN